MNVMQFEDKIEDNRRKQIKAIRNIDSWNNVSELGINFCNI